MTQFMASIRVLKRRIKTSKNIAKITRAMEMVAASKMKRAQDTAVAGRLYSDELSKVLDRLSSKISQNTHPLLSGGNPQAKIGIVVLSTNKGLCGGLNTNLFLKLNQLINQFKNKQFKIISVGKKAQSFCAQTEQELWASFTDIGDRPTSMDIRPIAKMITDSFINSQLSEVWIIYPKFISTLTQEPQAVKLLPLGTIDLLDNDTYNSQSDYLFEPEANQILDSLLPYYIENRIYQLLLETKASEQSARMVAMKNASDSATDIITDLTLSFNKQRQAKITNELLDNTTAALVVG